MYIGYDGREYEDAEADSKRDYAALARTNLIIARGTSSPRERAKRLVAAIDGLGKAGETDLARRAERAIREGTSGLDTLISALANKYDL